MEARQVIEVPENKDYEDEFLLLPSLVCPISYVRFKKPVVTADGHTFEEKDILEWFAYRQTSPVTNDPLPSRALLPNHALRNVLDEYLQVIVPKLKDLKTAEESLAAEKLRTKQLEAELAREKEKTKLLEANLKATQHQASVSKNLKLEVLKLNLVIDELLNCVSEDEARVALLARKRGFFAEAKMNEPNHSTRDFLRAIRQFDQDKIKKSLAKNPDINANDPVLKQPAIVTVIHKIAELSKIVPNTGYLILDLLLDLPGLEINKPDKDGNTALHWAAVYQLPLLVRKLVDHKADVLAINAAKETPFRKMLKTTQFNVEIANLLSPGMFPPVVNVRAGH